MRIALIGDIRGLRSNIPCELEFASAQLSTTMSVYSRSKTVSFRVTEEEYEQFRELCSSQGIAGVSNMVRAAVNLLVQQQKSTPQIGLESRLNALESRMHILALDLKKLSRTPASLHADDCDCERS